MSDEKKPVEASVPVSRIFLSLDNPRHEPMKTEAEVIEYLCTEEDVLPLARDIVKLGLSPLERFAMVPLPGKKGRAASPTYNVAEGNRRICALKLLGDPDLAPARQRKAFETLSEGWVPIKNVPAAIFETFDDARPWLDRTHSGAQGGIGRRSWDADQKQRFYGGSKNRLAQSLLDYAEREGMITREERQGKLTTAQRFLNNPVFRETIGLDTGTAEEPARNRPKGEFDTIVKRFMRDLVGGKAVTSRMNKAAITEYARPLAGLPGVTSTRIESEPLGAVLSGIKARVRRKPKKPEKARHVQYEQEISDVLKALGNEKLQSLYYSLTTVELEHHVPLVCIGAWAFFETLSACAGRNDQTAFKDFFSKARLGGYGLKGDTLSLTAALKRVSEYGNTSKHHPVSAMFNGDQLNNDMIALKGVILACVQSAAAA